MVNQRRSKCTRWLWAVAMAASLGPVAVAADSTLQWKGVDVRGVEVRIPAADRASIVLFVMPGQARSADAVRELVEAAKTTAGAQVVVVVSGARAGEDAAKLRLGEGVAWPVVADADYSVASAMGVRVWPTTVVVMSNGEAPGHLAGLSKNYARELEAYLALAAGKIDRGELEKRLGNHETVVDDAEQIAGRHLNVAQRLLDKGLPEQARSELAAGLKLQPRSPKLQLAMVRAMLILGEAPEALELLGRIDAGAVPPAQLNLLHGKALSAMGKLKESEDLLKQAIRLNPEPAEAWYELGALYEKQRDWPKAAEAYRHAFDATDLGRKLKPASR